MPHRPQLIELGWRQGALLAPDVDKRLTISAHYGIPDDARLLVVSQTCDLIQGDMDREPYFEVLCLFPLDREPGGDCAGGKNSREIEFSYTMNGHDANHWLSFPYKRHLVDRRMLLEHVPQNHIDDKHVLAMILSWLARRYTRVAFPEAFVDQINHPKRRSPISKKFARLNPFIANVYIRLEPFREIAGDESYDIELIFVMDSEKFEDHEHLNECTDIKNQLEYQLNQCDKIEVTDINIESSSAITFDDIKGFRE
ncbi:MAG: hypothetical protein KDI27_00485 [Gammaproteobacteria bacterium]|nr:hypothetical protein [Gammaproteobacteria bacterium]